MQKFVNAQLETAYNKTKKQKNSTTKKFKSSKNGGEDHASPPPNISIKTNINHNAYEENTTRGTAVARRKRCTSTENGARKTTARDG